MKRIAICAPGAPLAREAAERVMRIAENYPAVELHFHDQCFASEGHFAGSDAVRLAALLECANDPAFDAVWFAKGGYGSARIAEPFLGALEAAGGQKEYLGYSDTGTLLGALYGRQIGRQTHAPMPTDVLRPDGEAAVARVLNWLGGSAAGINPALGPEPVAAFNLMTLAMLVGTPLMPDLTGHVVLVEEVAEHLYAVDRLFFHITSQLPDIAGLRLGTVSAVPVNDRAFGCDEEAIARYWCERTGIPYLGRAQIGHDAENRIVPFGLARAPQVS
ncbi:MAG: LD-carboxypeptidase [Citromicrobium sp.]|nr:MAG: LD-carboxypeptidase [Citromicrobium sp.]